MIGVFLDLKKAFNTVDHTILLKKLYAYGIRGKAHTWLTSYLTGRTQYVVYDGHKSSTLNMTCGVPQGSILGPLLFIIYVNDICNFSDLLLKILYADDTCVVAQGHNPEDLIDTLNTELFLLNEWLLCNKLTLNTKKPYYMVIHRARIKLTNIDIDINGSKLQRVKCVKYLGLMVDQKLKWIDHIAHVKHKVPNDTVYKRWSCHSGLKLLCKLCRTSPPHFPFFLGMPAMRNRWMAGAAAHKSG